MKGRVRNEYPGDLFNSSFYAPLTNTIVTGRGSSTPTFTRATAAWSFDNEGKLNLNVPSGCVRFKGGRLVRNRAPASEDMQNVGWTKGDVSASSTTEIVENGTSGVHQLSVSITTFGDLLLRADVKRGSGTTRHIRLEISGTDGGRANFNVDTGDVTSTANIASGVLLGSGSAPSSAGYRTFWILVRIPTSQALGFYATRFLSGLDGAISYTGDTTSSFHVTNVQIENVSGQADQTASEYVSVGVLSSPYHGAGVDGCKWFSTNKDGSTVSSSTLEGYLAEPSRTNNCRFSRNLYGWTVSEAGGGSTPKSWVPSVTGSSLVTNGTFNTDLTGWTNNGSSTASVVSGKMRVDATGGNGGRYQDLTLTVGKTYYIAGDATLVSGSGTIVGTIYNATAFTPINKQTYLYASGSFGIIFKAVAATQRLYFSCIGSIVVDFDDIVVTECSCIPEQIATGLDNVANSASRLTAAATDATITQLLTASTGTRTLSAYIKRISGSGTISLTRDGGTGWTDITSSLVTGSWVLVQMTSDVGANPTVGIKMGASGDVIDVDCVQDENGAWATSPILTTTAAVTRNADVLSYASAFDVTQGTALCSAKSVIPINSGSQATLLDSVGCVMLYLSSGLARTSIGSYDGTNTASASGAGDITTGIRKRAVRWGADLKTSGDSLLGTAATFDGGMGSTGDLEVGSENSASQLSGTIREVHIWPTPLTDAQMQQVTK